METICAIFYKTGEMTDDDEIIIVDYLEDNGIKVSLENTREELCNMAMLHKFGDEEKISDFLYKEEPLSNIAIDLEKYGKLDINSYINIALKSDDRTLLTLMNISKKHRARFGEDFFKKYLELHYPNAIRYRGSNNYKEYYLKLIRAIDMLKRKYNFEYLSEEQYDVLRAYNEAERISKAGFNSQSYLMRYK